MNSERMRNDGEYWIKEAWPRIESQEHQGSGDGARWLVADGITARRRAGGSRKTAAILIMVFLGLMTLPRLVSAEGRHKQNPSRSILKIQRCVT